MLIETSEQYQELKARSLRNEAFVNTKRGKNGWASYKADEVPTDAQISNEERSAIEVYEFKSNPPEKYFLYVDQDKAIVTTWTGDVLGKVSFGCEYRSPGFGRCSVRVPITVSAINGKAYHGTYYKSSGNYARVKMAKQPRS